MNIAKLLKCVFFTPSVDGNWGLPLMVEGEPGIGKTAMFRQAARANALPIEVILASIREPSDFLGLPVPTGDCVDYMPPSWARRLADTGFGIVLFDEANTAPPSVQAATLRVAHERVVGDLALSARVRIVFAQNSLEDAAGGHETSIPLANRCLHLAWDRPNTDAWSDYMLGGCGEFGGAPVSESDDHPHSGTFAADEEARVLKAWPSAFAVSKALFTGFLKRRPELLHKKPKAGDSAASKAWPSPRSWEMATRVHAGAEIHGLDAAEQEMLVAGCVGTAAAAELIAYTTDLDLPDPADYLDGKVKWKIDKRLDRTMAVFSACATLVANPACDKRRVRAATLWNMLLTQVKDAADVVLPAAKVLANARLTDMPEAKPLMIALQPMFQAAGVFNR